jgi:glycerate dehydrogenase
LLDAFTADQGHADFWNPLADLGDVVRYERTALDQVLRRCQGAAIVCTNKVPFDAATFAALPALQYVGVLATGYNGIDIEAAKKYHVAVTNIPSYSTASVAQHTLGLLLELANGVGRHGAAVAAGGWVASNDFCFLRSTTRELAGQKLAVIGYGAIGQAFARVAQGLGISILPTHIPGRPGREDRVPLADALREADIVSLHCPLTPATERLVNRDFLRQCRDNAIILNTSRGGLIDEADLLEWLAAHPEARCGLDVLHEEPPATMQPLQNHSQVVVTPHIAWATTEARRRLRDSVVENIRAWQAGTALNRVD